MTSHIECLFVVNIGLSSNNQLSDRGRAQTLTLALMIKPMLEIKSISPANTVIACASEPVMSSAAEAMVKVIGASHDKISCWAFWPKIADSVGSDSELRTVHYNLLEIQHRAMIVILPRQIAMKYPYFFMEKQNIRRFRPPSSRQFRPGDAVNVDCKMGSFSTINLCRGSS